MSEFASLRLYFPMSARARATSLWHRISAPALSHHLLQCARRARIEQAVMHTVHSGYLPGQKMVHSHVETTPRRMPQCIELIDSESRLRKFLQDHADDLRHVRAVLYRCELHCSHAAGA